MNPTLRLVLTVSLGAFFAVLLVHPMLADENDAAIATWTKRTESLRSELTGADEQAVVDVAIASIYARLGNAEKAMPIVRRLAKSESEVAYSELWQLAIVVSEHLGGDAGNELLTLVEDPEKRGKIAWYVFAGFGACGDFPAAKRCQALIEDDDARFEAWIGFAATSTNREIAQAALHEAKPNSQKQRERLERMPDMLDAREVRKAKQPPAAKDVWAKAAASNDAASWRTAGAAYREEGDTEKARAALNKALAHVDAIDIESIRIGVITLIAHEFVEMNDLPEAARVMKIAVRQLEEQARDAEQGEGGAADELERLLSGLVVSPVFISTLARSGELDEAIRWATPVRQFAALGVGCASPQMQAELARRLSEIESPCDRALACAGVAQGCLERRLAKVKAP